MMLATIATSALAYDFQVDGIYYNINGTKATVTYNTPSYNDYGGNLNIPDSVTYNSKTYPVTAIGDNAFHSCNMLKSIKLSNTITSIGTYSFKNCKSLTSITIPSSVTSISSSAFYGCTSLTSIVVDEGNTAYDSRENCNAIIRSVNSALIIGCQITIIPNSVLGIASSAFFECTGLTKINIPSSITFINKDAFYDCTDLNRVEIEDLDAWCNISFEDYNSNPLYYAHHMFLNGEEVHGLVIPNTINEIGSWTFIGWEGLTSVTIPNSITAIGQGAFRGCSGLTNFVIPSSITSIGNYAFSGCSGLSNLNIPNSVNTIGNSAFSNCSGLTSVSIPNSITSISFQLFYNCTGLTSIVIPESVTSIKEGAFRYCSSLTSVTIPSSVTSIGNYAFHSCDGLQRITCMSTTPQDIDQNCFKCYTVNIYDQATLFVPAESLEAYKAHEEWGKFLHIVPFIGAGPGDVNGDGNIAINDVTNLIDMLLGGDDLPAWGDVDGDGSVGIKDVTTLIDLLLNNN